MLPAPAQEVAEILPFDAVEQVTSKVKDLSLKKTAEEEPSITHSELVNNLPADSQPKSTSESQTVNQVGKEDSKEEKAAE